MTYDDMTRAAAGAVLGDIPRAARLLKAMANPHRLQALCLMAEHGEISVGQIEARSGLSQSALSQHLGRLRRDDLVKTRRDAQTIFYSLNGPAALAVITTLARIGATAPTEWQCVGSTPTGHG